MSYIINILFFFNDTATTEIYTLSLHDALPIYARRATVTASSPPSGTAPGLTSCFTARPPPRPCTGRPPSGRWPRSEEHTSELQSRQYLECRLLLEKKYNLYFLLSYY